MSVYKPFRPQDYAVVPFNAHKQYDFTSASAAANKVEFQTTFFDYNSPVDEYTDNNIKYSQIEHMFYRNYITDIDNKFGDINYLKHKRALYEKANVMSVPSGLYGHKINPGSFFLSSSFNKLVDDTYGNLMVEGTNVNDYVTDPRKILLDIGPVKGFKRYDLDIHDEFENYIYYKRGQKRVNSLYTPELFENGGFEGFGSISDIYSPSINTPGLLITGSTSDQSIYVFNERLTILQNSPVGFTGVYFQHSAIKGTTYRLSVTGDERTGDEQVNIIITQDNNTITLAESNAGGYTSNLSFDQQPSNPTNIIYYTAQIDGDIKIYFRAYNDNVGVNTLDNISVKIAGDEGYTTPSDKYEYDDSYFLNKIYYNKILYNQYYLKDHPNISNIQEIDSIPCIEFNGFNSEIKKYHDNKFNFNYNDDFSIEFWVKPTHAKKISTEHIIGKSTTKTIIPTPAEGTAGIKSLSQAGSSQFKNISSEPQFPFEVYLEYTDNSPTTNPSIVFKRSNGDVETSTNTSLPHDIYSHIICKYSNSEMSIYLNGVKITSIFDIEGTYQNNANIYIGNKGGNSNYFNGSLSQIKIYNQSLTDVQINNNFNSINGSPYVGNIFYSNGIVTITHPKYQNILNLTNFGIGTMIVDNENEDIALFTVGNPHAVSPIKQLKFQGSHLIYENEYQCKVDEHEYNSTLNPSVRKHKSIQTEELADFATGSLFKPYITTIGLYNENNELLVVGKLGQPIKTSNETDTTFIVRWDT